MINWAPAETVADVQNACVKILVQANNYVNIGVHAHAELYIWNKSFQNFRKPVHVWNGPDIEKQK